MRFIDEVKIDVRAGNGGKGCVSFRREKYIPRGGPNGGDGGDGANVILVASTDKNTLQELYLRKHLFAENGHPGKGSNMHGRQGQDIRVQVPVGTIVKDEFGEVLADLTHDGDEIVLARGGKGGMGNARFATSTNRTPRYAQPGTEGEAGLRFLELKSMADVGLVGLPNAGKSTFIACVSNARPKIADYPFTTLVPALGQVFMDDGDGFVVADIPGLIEGAHEGKGLGHRFLRHVERTNILLHLVDLVSPEGHSVREMFDEVNRELAGYGGELLSKTRFLVLTKADALDEAAREEVLESVKDLGLKTYMISSVTKAGVSDLLHDVYAEVRRMRETA